MGIFSKFIEGEAELREPFSEKLKRHLTTAEFAQLITDCLSHKETARLMASLGAVFPGTRIESIEHRELAEGFAEDVWKDPVLLASLEQALDKALENDLAEAKVLSVRELKGLLSHIPEIFERRGIGKMVWMLLRDPRREVTGLLRPFLKSVYRYTKKEHQKLRKREDFMKRLQAGTPSREDVEELKHALFSLSADLRGTEKALEQREKKLQAGLKERDRLRTELSSTRREHDTFHKHLGAMRKSLAQKEAAIETLREEAKKITRAEEKDLHRRIRNAEREQRKQQHELLDAGKKISALEEALALKSRSCASLAAQLESALENKTLLEIKLAELARDKAEKNKTASAEKKSPGEPKEKGRRLGVFVDMQNIWIAAKRFRRKIDFQKLLDLTVLDRHLVKAIAYVVVIPGLEQEPFFSMLKRKGFEVRCRTLIRRSDGSAKGNWDTGIVVDAIDLAEKRDLDIVHVVSGDGDFVDLLKFLKTKGVRVEASGFPFNTAQDLMRCVDEFIPLSDEILKAEETVPKGVS